MVSSAAVMAPSFRGKADIVGKPSAVPATRSVQKTEMFMFNPDVAWHWQLCT
jgi:hypothetical protein